MSPNLSGGCLSESTKARDPVSGSGLLPLPHGAWVSVGHVTDTASRRGAELELLPAGHAEHPGKEEVTTRAAAATRAHLARSLGG